MKTNKQNYNIFKGLSQEMFLKFSFAPYFNEVGWLGAGCQKQRRKNSCNKKPSRKPVNFYQGQFLYITWLAMVDKKATKKIKPLCYFQSNENLIFLFAMKRKVLKKQWRKDRNY